MTPTSLKMVPRWSLLLFVGLALGSAAPSAVAQQSTPTPEEQFATGVQLFEQQLHPEAAEALQTFRRLHSSHVLVPQSLYLEAQTALAEEEGYETRRLLTRLQDRYPGHPRAQDARLSLAQYYSDQGLLDEAATELELIAADPQGPSEGARALYLLGRTAQRQDNLESALSYFDQVHSRYPNADIAPVAVYAKGVVQVRLERYENATASFETLGAEYPNSPFSENLGTLLAEVYYRLDRYDDAAAELERRLPELQGRTKARALFLLGESYNQLRQGDAAVSNYRALLENHSESQYAPPARYGLGRHYLRAEQYSDAATAFAQVRSTDTDLALPATYYEAVARTLMGEQREALELYRSFLEQESDGRLVTEAQFERGLLLYQQEQYEEAASAFQRVVRSADPERTGRAYYWLGNAYMASQQTDPALEAYSQAQEREAAPASILVEVQFQDAWSSHQNGDYREAAAAFRALANEHPDTPRGKEALMWAADAEYQRENYGRAQSLYMDFLHTDVEGHQRAGALYGLGWTHFKQRQFGPAARQFQAFLNSFEGSDTNIPYRQDARLRLADCYIALKQYGEAIAVYERVGGEGSAYAAYQAGRALSFSDNTEEARDRLRTFVEEYPNSDYRADALYRIAGLHFQEQEYEQAREAYRRVVDEYPDHPLAPRAQYAIGDSYYNADQMNDAVEAYRTVLERYPESESASEAASSIFFALNAAGQTDRAPELIQSIAENSSDPSIEDRLRFQRARAAYQSGQSKRALRLFREFVRTTSADDLVPRAYYHLGLLYADLDQDTEAQNYLQQLVDRYPESEHSGDAALRLGDIYFDGGDFSDAAEAYRSAAEASGIGDELQAQARYGEAMALLQRDQIDEAETLLQQILSSENEGPLVASARLGLGRIRERQGRTSEALSLYRRVVESVESETGAEALYRLGHLLREQGRTDEAIRELDRMPTLFAGYPEWSARALLEQARTYRDVGQTGQATQLFDEVIQEFRGTPFAETAREEKNAISASS